LKINRLGSKEKNCRKLTNNALGLLEMAILLAGAMVILCTGALAVHFTSTLAEENTADYWLMKGYEQSKNGSNDMALLAYERAIQIDPDNSLAWINKANALYRLNRTPESENAYRIALNITDKMLEADSDNSTLWLGRGVLLNNIGKAKEAVEAFDRASNIDPGNEMAWKMKGVLLASDLKEYDKALAAFDRALQINPNDAVIWKLKGDALAASGLKSEADLAFLRAGQLNNETASFCLSSAAGDNSTDDWTELGRALVGNMSYEEALYAYDQATEIDPENKEAWMGKTDCLCFLKRSAEAKESAEKALKLYNQSLEKNSSDFDSWMAKAHIYSSLAWADRAGFNESYLESSLLAVSKALHIQPNNSSALLFQGGALSNLGRYEEALIAFDRALEIGFPPSESWRNEALAEGRGLALAALGRVDEAENSYKDVQDAAKDQLETANSTAEQVESWIHLGMLLQEQGKLTEALQAFDNATALDPKSAFSWKVKGYIQAVWLGRYDEGLDALNRSLDIEQSADVWEVKARVLCELGRYDEAIDAVNRSLLLDQNFSRVWLVKGHVLRELGRHQEAMEAYDRSGGIYGEQLYSGMGFSLAHLNRSDEASQSFNKSLNEANLVLARDPMSAYAWFWKGEALRGLGQYHDALQSYERSLEISSEKAISSWRGMGYALEDLGRVSEAKAAFSRAVELGYKG